MPRLGELVASGTSYDDTVSTINLSRPALVTILTGVSPDRSGVRDNIHDRLPTDLPCLAELAKGAGYETAAFVSTPFASYSSGLQRGYELFDGPEALVVGPAQHVPPVVAASKVAEHFKQWLSTRAPGRPYFVWIHLADLSSLSVPLPSSTEASDGKPADDFADYQAALAKIDDSIGTILDAVHAAGVGASPVEWTLVGTHGTYFGEGGRYGGAFWLSEETLHVPLVRISAGKPDAPKAAHEARPSWLPDVAATLARAMGVTLDAKSDGIPLDSPPPPGRARLAWGYALDDQLAWPPETAVREGTGFTIFSGAAVAGNAAVAARPALPRRRVLPVEARAALERAGVKLGSGTNSAPPPKNPEAWLRDLQLVRRYLAMGRPRLAVDRAKLVADAQPEAFASLLIKIILQAGDVSRVDPSARDKLLARYPDRSDALHWAAHLALDEKKLDVATALLDAAMAVGPVEPEMRYDLACARSLGGDVKGALEELDRALGAGYRNWDWIDKDPDLARVRADRGFPSLLGAHGR